MRMFCNIYSLIPNIIFFSVGQPDPLDLIDLHLDTCSSAKDGGFSLFTIVYSLSH